MSRIIVPEHQQWGNVFMETERRDRRKRDIELGPLGREKGKIIASVDAGNMVAVLSGMELMFVFRQHEQYHCFIHKFDAEDGRHKAFPVNERNTAMMDNLHSAADALFEIKYEADMDRLGVMVTAETGIIRYLDMTGNLPAEDMDFMDWQDKPRDSGNNTREEKEEA